jgi:hypothetical protein
MKRLLMMFVAAATLATGGNAGIGETYQQSNRHYGSVATWIGDHASWIYRGFVVTEGFNNRGFCDITIVSHYDCTDMTDYEVTTLLRGILPPGCTWSIYKGSAYGPTWSLNYRGVNWYAMYYTNVGTRGGYTVYSKCLRVGTEESLAGRGYLSGPAPQRLARDISRPASRASSKPRPKLAVQPGSAKPADRGWHDDKIEDPHALVTRP